MVAGIGHIEPVVRPDGDPLGTIKAAGYQPNVAGQGLAGGDWRSRCIRVKDQLREVRQFYPFIVGLRREEHLGWNRLLATKGGCPVEVDMGMVGAIGKTQANVLQALGQLDAAFRILVGHGAARNLLVVDEELCFINRLQPKTIDPWLRDRDLARPLHRVGAGQGRDMEIEVELGVDACQGLGPLPVAIAVILAQ